MSALVARGVLVATGVLGALNVILLLVANADRSWVAAGIGALYGPALNLAAGITLLLVSNHVAAWSPIPRPLRMALLALLALLGAAADFAFVSRLPLHGC
jgi:hypothetical protein